MENTEVISGVDQPSTILQTVSVQDFMSSKGFISVVKTVRKNTNGYPYITFMNGANEAENIYFSKNASAKVDEGDLIEKGFFSPFTMVLTTNADNEQRWKISAAGEGNRIGLADLF